MKSYAALAFNSGLFTLLSAVLKPAAPGYDQFQKQAKDSWQDLGLQAEAIDEILLSPRKLSTEKRRAAIQDEMPLLIEKSYGPTGRCFYDLGFGYGTFLLLLMSNQNDMARDYLLRFLKYKCAEARNPEVLHSRILEYEQNFESGGTPDLMYVVKSAEDIYLWIVANTSLTRKCSIVESIFEISVGELPYVGKPLREFFKHLREK